MTPVGAAVAFNKLLLTLIVSLSPSLINDLDTGKPMYILGQQLLCAAG